jgi:hypothetical protein
MNIFARILKKMNTNPILHFTFGFSIENKGGAAAPIKTNW